MIQQHAKVAREIIWLSVSYKQKLIRTFVVIDKLTIYKHNYFNLYIMIQYAKSSSRNFPYLF